MNTGFWRVLFFFSVTMIVLLAISIPSLEVGTDSYYIAIISLVINILFLSLLGLLIRKNVELID